MRARAQEQAPERSKPAGVPAGRASAGALGTSESLLRLQRLAGNRTTTEVVRRVTAEQSTNAKKQADDDFKAGASASYFAGNFLANHIEEAGDKAKADMGGSGVAGSKAARGQAYKKLEDRAYVEGGGSGWGPKKKSSGANTLILDFGPQLNYLMRAVNVEQVDQLAADPRADFFEFYTEEKVRAITYGSDGRREEKKGKAHLGARLNAGLNRYQINHLSGIG